MHDQERLDDARVRAAARHDAEAAAFEGEISLAQLIQVVLRRRAMILAIVVAGVLVGALVAFLTPSVYKARTKVVPVSFLMPSNEFGAMAQLRGAASQLGLTMSTLGDNPSFLFPQIAESADLLQRVLVRKFPAKGGGEVDLNEVLDIEPGAPERRAQLAALALKEAVECDLNYKTGITTISAAFRDPVLAAAVANATAEELDRFILDMRTSQAGEKVRFITKRLAEVSVQLAEAEEALTSFRLRNRQVMGAPSLMLEESRRMREVTASEQIFLTLKTQLEIARIEESRSMPGIAVVERATPPLIRHSPRRARVLAIALFASGAVAMLAALVADRRPWASD